MSELKPCPNCGVSGSVGGGQLIKMNCDCYGKDKIFDIDIFADLEPLIPDPRLKQAVEEIETMGRNCMKGDVRKDGLLLALYIFEKHFPELKEAKDE